MQVCYKKTWKNKHHQDILTDALVVYVNSSDWQIDEERVRKMIEKLKKLVPWQCRRWEPNEKVWYIFKGWKDYQKEVIRLLQDEYFLPEYNYLSWRNLNEKI